MLPGKSGNEAGYQFAPLDFRREHPAPIRRSEVMGTGPSQCEKSFWLFAPPWMFPMTEAISPFLLPDEVYAITRMCDLTLSRMEKRGRFPKRVRIGNRKIAWRRADIDLWVADPEGWGLSTGHSSIDRPVIEQRAKVVL
jgi:prophage regulatory protein